jgi:hypothetical protein
MGEKMSRVTRVTAGLIATALAGVLTVTTVQPGASAAPATAAATQAVPRPANFTISSFNVLGASHTPAGGSRAAGTTRIVWANQLLERHHIDVAGFQELQAPQLTKFLAITKGEWAVYPGLQLNRIDSENSVGWRTDKFTLVSATTLTIPYFNGNPRRMPLVLLRDRATGMLAYFANFHNPAETAKYRNQGRYRAAATTIEIALQNALYRRGIPRFMTGDMNERAPYFCRVTAESPVVAARPTSYRRDGVCYAGRPRSVDWIFGARKVDFHNYVEDRSPLVAKTTDHPVIVSDVTVSPSKLPRAWNRPVAPPMPTFPLPTR